jgi:hypothetical protein
MALGSFFPDPCVGEPSSGEEFLPATLEGVRRCPARPEYIELCFTTGEGAWNWCFPPPARELKRPAEPVALVLGPYGVLARRIADDGLGLALDHSVALPMILAGADVVVARRLVTAGR